MTLSRAYEYSNYQADTSVIYQCLREAVLTSVSLLTTSLRSDLRPPWWNESEVERVTSCCVAFPSLCNALCGRVRPVPYMLVLSFFYDSGWLVQ